jgi:uncharacterized protein YjbI with pentapeptide repeats
MANRKHLAILEQSVDAWDHWRGENPEVMPDLSGAQLSDAKLLGADLRGANLSEANLSGADLRGADISEANLSGADLRGADLRRAGLLRAGLSWANLSEAYLSEAHLSLADLTGANLSGADLREANLTGANLSGASLSGASLTGVDLSDANLSGARLRGANLSGAYLGGMDLSEADLGGANLSGADLSRANLRGADLRGATLHFVNLDRAILTDAKLWETLRAGWSIKGVHCERAFWDEKGVEPTEYGPKEFERLYSDQQLVELIYPDGMTRFELNTLPALIQHLENVHQGARLRLKSVEEVAGGARVSIVVEDTQEASLDKLQKDAVELQSAQMELRDERRRRERLEIEKKLLLDEVFPLMLASLAPKQITATASGGSTIVVESTHVEARSYQAIKDLDAVKSLVDEIFGQRMELGLPNAQLTRLEEAIQATREELRAGQPKTSALREGLNTLRNVVEGAVGSALAAAAREHWSEILQTLSQLLQRLQ